MARQHAPVAVRGGEEGTSEGSPSTKYGSTAANSTSPAAAAALVRQCVA